MQLLSFPWERCGSYESAISPFGRMRMAGAKRVGPDQWTDRSIGSGGENRGLTSRQARPVHWTLCLHRIGGAQTITELPIHFLSERKGGLADLWTEDEPDTSSWAEKRGLSGPWLLKK